MTAHQKKKKKFLPFFIGRLFKIKNEEDYLITPKSLDEFFYVHKSNRSRLLEDFCKAGIFERINNKGYKLKEEFRKIEDIEEFFYIISDKLTEIKNSTYNQLIIIIKLIPILSELNLDKVNITDNLIRKIAEESELKISEAIIDKTQTYLEHAKSKNRQNINFDMFEKNLINTNTLNNNSNNIETILKFINVIFNNEIIDIKFKKLSLINISNKKYFEEIKNFVSEKILYQPILKNSEENISSIISTLSLLLNKNLKNDKILILDKYELHKKINYFKIDYQLMENHTFLSNKAEEIEEIFISLSDAIHIANILNVKDKEENVEDTEDIEDIEDIDYNHYITLGILLLYFTKFFKFKIIKSLQKINKYNEKIHSTQLTKKILKIAFLFAIHFIRNELNNDLKKRFTQLAKYLNLSSHQELPVEDLKKIEKLLKDIELSEADIDSLLEKYKKEDEKGTILPKLTLLYHDIVDLIYSTLKEYGYEIS